MLDMLVPPIFWALPTVDAPNPHEPPAVIEPLTQDEIQSIINQIQRCWRPPLPTQAPVVTLEVGFASDGSVTDVIELSGETTPSPSEARAAAAHKAVERCAPYEMPAEKYVHWQRIRINFQSRQEPQ